MIVYETRSKRFYVYSGSKGFTVFRNDGTHAVRVASIGNGPGPLLGIERAKAEADKRERAEVTSVKTNPRDPAGGT